MTNSTELADRERIEKAAHHARLLADALDALPAGIPAPTHTNVYTHAASTGPDIGWLLFGAERDHDAQKETALAVVRAMGGKWNKNPGHLFGFRTSRNGVDYHVTVDREAVCRRVVTGTREVTTTVPADDAPTVQVTETVEDVKWVCEPLLNDAADKAEAITEAGK
jgi:hypothetical protein